MADQNKKASLEKLDECEQIIIGILESFIEISENRHRALTGNDH